MSEISEVITKKKTPNLINKIIIIGVIVLGVFILISIFKKFIKAVPTKDTHDDEIYTASVKKRTKRKKPIHGLSPQEEAEVRKHLDAQVEQMILGQMFAQMARMPQPPHHHHQNVPSKTKVEEISEEVEEEPKEEEIEEESVKEAKCVGGTCPVKKSNMEEQD